MQGIKDWAIDCLKKPETGYREGEGRNETVLLREQRRGVKDQAVDRKKSETGRKMMLRVIELGSVLALPRPNVGILSSINAPPRFNLDSVKVEEYHVWRSGSSGL